MKSTSSILLGQRFQRFTFTNTNLFSIMILQGHTQVNFVSTLLRVTMSDQLDLPVRQAGEFKLFQKMKNVVYANLDVSM